MRQACHLIFAAWMLTAFCPATAECQPDSLWNHNGSVMALYLAGDGRVLRYQEPRIGMRQEGVVAGTVRFEGIRSGNTYSGTAFVFSRRCGSRAYPVTGTASEDGREIKISGIAPTGFDAACRPIVFRKEAAHFSFLRFVEPPPLLVGSIQSAAEAKEREEQWLRDLREIEERRLVEMRSFASQRDGCQEYNVEACDNALSSPHASRRDVIDLRNWRGVAKKLHADLDSCRTGSVTACDAALMSPAVSAEQRPLLDEWRIAATPLFKRAVTQLSTHAGAVATATIDGVAVIRNLPTSAHVMGGLAAALALAGIALRRRLPLPIGGPHTRAPAWLASHIATSTNNQARSAVAWLRRLCGSLSRLSGVIPHPASLATHDTSVAIAALELARAYIHEVREADTPGFEDHELRNHHLNALALASKQLNAAERLDPDAILEGQDEKEGAYSFSINDLKAEALMLAGITHHAFDIERAISALRKATTLNANSPHAFYILGLAHAANMNKPEALAALQRAVALNPKNLSYRKELHRVQRLSPGEVA